jgi:hypothetical protein
VCDVSRHRKLPDVIDMGCDIAKGYLFSRPVSAVEAVSLVNQAGRSTGYPPVRSPEPPHGKRRTAAPRRTILRPTRRCGSTQTGKPPCPGRGVPIPASRQARRQGSFGFLPNGILKRARDAGSKLSSTALPPKEWSSRTTRATGATPPRLSPARMPTFSCFGVLA